MDNCVFCKIINGEIPSAKYWENDEYMAFLDIHPNINGASLFVPKVHYNSDYSQAPDNVLSGILLAVREPTELLKRYFNTPKVGLVFEGVGIGHLHLKMYPLIGFDSSTGESTDTIFLDKYPGYLTTKLGPQTDFDDLMKLAEGLEEVG